MKNYNFSFIFICTIILSMTTSCDHAEIQKSQSPQDEQFQIQTRSDCEACPEQNDCCCAVYLDLGDNDAFLQICGTSDGGGSCSGSPVCGLLSPTNGFQQIDLDNVFNPGQLFCLGKGNPIWIYNYSTTDIANIVITCQVDHTSPQEIQVQILPGHRFYYEANSACELALCQ